MASPAIEANDGWWYGLGLDLREREGRREIRHGGSMPGFGSTMLGDLDSGLGVVVGVNATDEQDLTEGVAEAILALYRDGICPRVRIPGGRGRGGLCGRVPGEAGRLGIEVKAATFSSTESRSRSGAANRFLAGRPDLSLYFLRFRREGDRIVAAVHGGNIYRREDVPAAPALAPPEAGAPTPATTERTTPGTRTSASSCEEPSCS